MSTAQAAAPRIVVLGSANMDLVATTDRLPAPGETILGRAFTLAPGGKGLNQAIAAARAGAEVDFLGAVGDDTFALELREVLVLNDVGTEYLREVEGPSGVAVITVDSCGENSIIVVGDANSTITDLTDEELEAVSAAEILICQLELPIKTVTSAARHARAHGTKVLLNPSPVQELPHELVACVDIMVLNKLEAERLGNATLADVPHVVTTLGPDGATYSGPDGVEDAAAAPHVEVVDTTGSGDAFAGALAVAWNQGPAEALRWACVAGALATTKLGASASLPTRDEIEQAFVGAGPQQTLRLH